MEVSFATYLSVVVICLLILWIIRSRTRNDSYLMDDRADLVMVIGCIIFWPLIISILLLGIVLFLCSLPFIAIATLISWIISVFKKDT